MVASPLPTQPRFVIRVVLVVGAILTALLACARSAGPAGAPWSSSGEMPVSVLFTPGPTATQGLSPDFPAMFDPNAPILSPTPDNPRVLPTLRSEPEEYFVAAGDTLGKIARVYNIDWEELVKANELTNPDLLEIGQRLLIPAPTPQDAGPGYKIIPDTEMVLGPTTIGFSVEEYVEGKAGYLAQYTEEVDGVTYTGAQVIERIAFEFSINPRLLLAVLEYRSGWVTQPEPDPALVDQPIAVLESWKTGLYRQMSWAADNLNRGYYLWRVNGVGAWVLAEGEVIPVDPTINAGTAAIQHFFSNLYGRQEWETAVSPGGLAALYESMFGYPFLYMYEPLLPSGLAQPTLQLPFEDGKEWSFTGGPHGGWGSGSAWAAIDFAPPGPARGCVTNDDWVVAIADGLIVRTGDGAVVQDLDVNGQQGDGYEQTGWSVLYMHVESRGRVEAGVYVQAGERIGHPSCEGGYSTGTHLHLARRFNGEWIPADQTMPFVLDGWVSRGAGYEYDGYLQKDGLTIEALEGRYPENAIQR